MATNGIKVNMAPSHPGDFIRTEVIEELGLNVTRAAEILGIRRATLGPAQRQRLAVAGDGATHREGIRREYGHAAADAGLVRGLARCAPEQVRSASNATSPPDRHRFPTMALTSL